MTDGYKIKRILVGTQQVWPAGWKPGADTMIYMPFTADLLNHSNKSITLSTTTATLNSSVLSGKTVGDFTSSHYIQGTNIDNMAHDSTISFRMKGTTTEWIGFAQGPGSNNRALHFGFSTSSRGLYLGLYANDYESGVGIGTINNGNWHYCVATYNATTYLASLYLDGSFIGSKTMNSGFYAGNNTFTLGKSSWDNYNCLNGYMSEFILESKIWTADEISTYYNNIKSQYGY